MVMQTVKIYRARFRWFFGLTATTFARLTPETLSFRFSCARKRTLCSMVSVSITVTGDAVAAS
nr:hypothetical protein [Enterobacter asburiae]